MTLKLEVWTGSRWSPIKAGTDGQPRYLSNGGLVGEGMRITRVSDGGNSAPVGQNIIAEVTT